MALGQAGILKPVEIVPLGSPHYDRATLQSLTDPVREAATGREDDEP